MSNLIPDFSINNQFKENQRPPAATLNEQIKQHWQNNKKRYKVTAYCLLILIIFLGGGWSGYFYSQKYGRQTE
ncbi:MAG: hypothetical protein ACOZAJ_03380, partial [Patescibacteria group bacterium]